MYIPKTKKKKWEEYEAIKLDCRRFVPTDTGKIHVSVLLLMTRGNAPRDAFQGYEIVVADIGRVSNKMVDLFVRPRYLTGYPLRFKIETEKALIIERK